MISSFYSQGRKVSIADRIQNASEDIHLFYRSFPPLFYQFAEDQDWRHKFGGLSSFLSVMAGDAHMENFGLKFYEGKLRLSVNDYDDLTSGPPFLDFLRLMTSARLAGIDLNNDLIISTLKSYRQGLDQKKWAFSKTTMGLVKKSDETSLIDSSKIDSLKKIFLKKKEPFFSVAPKELSQWKKALAESGEIRDSYLYIKQNGGSAGLKRFQFLLEKDGELRWIEAKEWDIPSYNTASKISGPDDIERFEMITTYDKPMVAPRLAKVFGKTFYLRNIDARQLGVTIAELKKNELIAVLMDEAYSLGDFHRTFLSDKNGYRNALAEQTHEGEIQDFVKEIKHDFQKAFDAAKTSSE
jgi:hypothetical protein